VNIVQLRWRSNAILLEPRINCAVVKNLSDYKPIFNINDKLTYPVEYSLRWAINEVIANGGAVTFNTDPNAGVDFDDPANPKTIAWEYGEISIVDKGVAILGPRSLSLDPSLPYVGIHYNAGVESDDRSVFDISVVTTNESGSLPVYSQIVQLAGLKITGGEAAAGAGINVYGTVSLQIIDCEISGRTYKGANEQPSPTGTQGGGLFASGI